MSAPTIPSDIYHEGERAVQERAGATEQARRNSRVIKTTIIPGAIRFVNAQPFVVMGSVSVSGEIWASLVIGSTGFVTATPDSLDIDLSRAMRCEADPLWRNLADDPRIGVLLIDLFSRARLRVNGRVAYQSDDRLRIDVEQAYPNCPQYIQRRNFQPKLDHDVRLTTETGTALTGSQQQWLARTDTLFVASGHPSNGLDASHRGGTPGFARVLDSTHLRIPDYAGNAMFNTLGNFAVNPRAGIAIPDFENGRTLQLTGRVQIQWDIDDPHKETEGTGRYWDFTIARWIQIDGSLAGTAT